MIDIVVGVDEAGRGPWAGPVVAVAVNLQGAVIDGVNDSKKLSAKKREGLFPVIMEKCDVGIGIVDVQIIDDINILQATMLAMKKAVENLQNKPDLALIDGNKCPDLTCETQAIIGGDAIHPAISAASIIAKVTRDRIMCDLHEQFPNFGWNTNAGYGTKAHQEGLAKFGITPHHRKSFAPIKKLL